VSHNGRHAFSLASLKLPDSEGAEAIARTSLAGSLPRISNQVAMRNIQSHLYGFSWRQLLLFRLFHLYLRVGDRKLAE